MKMMGLGDLGLETPSLIGLRKYMNDASLVDFVKYLEESISEWHLGHRRIIFPKVGVIDFEKV